MSFHKIRNTGSLLSRFAITCANPNRKHVPLLYRPFSTRFFGGRLRLNHSAVVSVGRGLWLGVLRLNTYSTVLTKAKAKMPERKPFERLPSTVKPKHYKLVLTPDLKTFTFQGDVSIQIEVSLNICRAIENSVKFSSGCERCEGNCT